MPDGADRSRSVDPGHRDDPARGEDVQVRCPRCDAVGEYDKGFTYRKVTCRKCEARFVATSGVIVDPPPERPDADAARPVSTWRLPRVTSVLVLGALLAGNVVLAYAWSAARSELDELNGALEGLPGARPARGSSPGTRGERAKGGGPPGEAASAEAGDPATDVGGKDKVTTARLVMALQKAAMEDLNEEVEGLRKRLEQSERALDREKKNHRQTRNKIDGMLKENARLKRELTRCTRSVEFLERKLERTR